MTAESDTPARRQLSLSLGKGFAEVARDTSSRSDRSSPFSIRLSNAERLKLEQQAGLLPLGAYVRSRLLEGAVSRPGRSISRDEAKAMGKLMAKLGSLQWSASLAEIAAAAKRGAVVLTPELQREIEAVCADIREVRQLAMRSLGLKPEAGP